MRIEQSLPQHEGPITSYDKTTGRGVVIAETGGGPDGDFPFLFLASECGFNVGDRVRFIVTAMGHATCFEKAE